jgi:pyruvate,water dikinase
VASGGRFAIVQARPFTGLCDPWNDSLTGDYLWTSTNLGEAIPDVMTPCTWSLVQIFMRHAMATAAPSRAVTSARAVHGASAPTAP